MPHMAETALLHQGVLSLSSLDGPYILLCRRNSSKSDAGESSMKIPKRVNSRNPETNCAVIVLIISCDGVAGRGRLRGLVIANAGMQKPGAMCVYV